MKRDNAEILAMLLKLYKSVNELTLAVENLKHLAPGAFGQMAVHGHLAASREALDEFLQHIDKAINADV